MNNNDTLRFNKETLEFLRANTTLGPIALLKIIKLKREIDKAREWYFKLEGELLEADYTAADELEYELRLRVWENICAQTWKQIPDDIGLYDYSIAALEHGMLIPKYNHKR